jgi:hypothetical protein
MSSGLSTVSALISTPISSITLSTLPAYLTCNHISQLPTPHRQPKPQSKLLLSGDGAPTSPGGAPSTNADTVSSCEAISSSSFDSFNGRRTRVLLLLRRRWWCVLLLSGRGNVG